MWSERIGDGIGDCRIGDHADLDGIDAHIGKDGLDLLGDELRRHQMHAANPLRVLRRQRGQYRHAIDATGRECLEVGLDAGAAGRVGAGDGKNVSDHERAFLMALAMRRVAASGSGVPQMAETTARPLAPAKQAPAA